MPSTSSTTRVRYLIFCNAWWSKCFQYSTSFRISPHFASLHVYKPYMEAIMPVKYQHFHCKDPSAMFFSLETALLVTGKKNSSLESRPTWRLCQVLQSHPFPPNPQLKRCQILNVKKNNTWIRPASGNSQFLLSFSFYTYHFDGSSNRKKIVPLLEISCLQVSQLPRGPISKDRTLMNESLCSLSMLWRFRLGLFFFSMSDMQISMQRQISLCDRFTGC